MARRSGEALRDMLEIHERTVVRGWEKRLCKVRELETFLEDSLMVVNRSREQAWRMTKVKDVVTLSMFVREQRSSHGGGCPFAASQQCFWIMYGDHKCDVLCDSRVWLWCSWIRDLEQVLAVR